jgi:hypothetical protein
MTELVELAYAEGLIIYSRRTRGGVDGDHFLVCPPMITSEDQVDEIIDMLTSALDKFAAKVGLACRDGLTGDSMSKIIIILRRHRLDPHALDVTLSAGDGRGDRRAGDRRGRGGGGDPASACPRSRQMAVRRLARTLHGVFANHQGRDRCGGELTTGGSAVMTLEQRLAGAKRRSRKCVLSTWAR